MIKHIITRENDELACSCGLRWDIDEDDPHDGKEQGRQTLKELKEMLNVHGQENKCTEPVRRDELRQNRT